MIKPVAHKLVDELLDSLAEQKSLGGEVVAQCLPKDPDTPAIEVRVRILITPLDEDGQPDIIHMHEGKDVDISPPPNSKSERGH